MRCKICEWRKLSWSLNKTKKEGNSRKKITGLLLALMCPFVSAQELAYTDKPMLQHRKDVHSDAMEALFESIPEWSEFTRKYYARVGISETLSNSQIEYFRSNGTDPGVLFDFVAEFGITPEENERLAGAGVTFLLDNVVKFDDFHWAALSDTIVEGRVSSLEGYPQGIYHTKVGIEVYRTYKECGPSPQQRQREFWLLQTGPHQQGDHVDNIVVPAEPKFRRGEEVLIMAGRNPVNLRTMVGNKLVKETLHLLEESFGPPEQLLRRASEGQSGVLEIYAAFKVVRNNFVRKGGGYRIKSPTDLMDREYFQQRIDGIVAAQRQACQQRVLMVENRK